MLLYKNKKCNKMWKLVLNVMRLSHS